MKRALLIAAALLAFAAAADAADYTFLDPPTLAVADFEVSMSAADKEAPKAFYGQLISQALLSVLVQQNAASVVYAPRDGRVTPGAPVYDPGTSTLTARVAAADSAANRAASSAIDRAADAYARATDDAAKARAMDAAVKAASEAAADSRGLEEIARVGERQVARLYFPSIFKIYDKKYVENALQNGTFTVRDLYTKAVGAFNFTDLDFLVLGNVYETSYGTQGAIGFNVRVLNTKRAEEVYSYAAVVGKDLHDLPIACAEISQRIMLDLLSSNCAQLTITESPELAGKGGTGVDAAQAAQAGGKPDYRLFWQPRQVERDDNTVGDSDNSHKRAVQRDVFYWTLPGQYIISVYNRKTQQIKEIPFTIAAGDIRNIVIEMQHIETPKGSITISGIGPTTSYVFEATPKKQREQYWWEIFDPPMPQDPFTITFASGEILKDGQDKTGGAADSVKTEKVIAEYRPATQDILISNVPLAVYDIIVTRNPPEGLSGITGVWYTSTKLTLTSKPLSVTVRVPKDVKLPIADFGLQEKQQIESPRTTKVTFILQPGFGYWGWIYVDDQSLAVDRLYWADKEKITITSEYTQADWEALPEVTYTIWTRGASKDGAYLWWQGQDETFMKNQIAPEKDIVVFVDLAALRSEAEQNANRKAGLSAAASTQQAALAGQTSDSAQGTVKATAPAGRPSRVFLGLGSGIGYGSYFYQYTSPTFPYNTTTYSGTGMAITAAAQLSWYLAPGFGLGVGGLFDMVIGGNAGGALTLDLLLGDITRQTLVFTADLGFGSGFAVGGGLVFLNAKKNGGLTVGVDFFASSSSGFSVSVSFGYLFGF